MEASGTSGQKAAINGVLNLSLLDGWWGEGFNGENGWGIAPHSTETNPAIRDREEANELLEILEYEIIPTFYKRGKQGYSKEWIKLSKNSMKSCIPRFNASRMVMDYVKNLYTPACAQYDKFKRDDYAAAKELAQWKIKIKKFWTGISFERIDDNKSVINDGEALNIQIKVNLNGLKPIDVAVECIVDSEEDNEFINAKINRLKHIGEYEDSHLFSIDLQPDSSGVNYYKIRIIPFHKFLSHPMETGFMLWL
ncbi:MAG: hypothetical protein QM484_12765 [Woeseiaceae bacterium]